MSPAERRDEWISSLMPGQFRHLFDHLPGTLFFAKDRHGRLMAGNPAFVKHCGLASEEELTGLTDDRIFPARLAEKYRRDDELVLTEGRPLLGLIELFPNREGKPEWFITDKIPLRDHIGKVCGVCGTVRSYEAQRAAIKPYLELAGVAEHLRTNFRDKLNMPALARMAAMSVRQLERKFRATFQMTPRDFLIRMRLVTACEQLARTSLPLTTIAHDCGFYDHSDFARQFRRQMGQTASQYRIEHRGGAKVPEF